MTLFEDIRADHRALRADMAELRHQFDLMRVEMGALRDRVRADISDAFVKQTRWMLGGLVLLLIAILFKG